jgi:diacylglycerol O-acyltransferase / wax synthase
VEQLSGLDSVFLALDGDRFQGHAGGVGIFDASALRGPLTLEALHADIAFRLGRLPVLRRRLYTVPLGLDHPYWVEDPSLDLSHHLREHTLGAEETLEGLLSRLHSERLSRDHPLWELHLIHGLASGRQAIYLKIHHAVVDGVAGNDVLGALFDADPDGGGSRGNLSQTEMASATLAGLLVGSLHNLVRGPGRVAVVGSAALKATPRLINKVRAALPHSAQPVGLLTAPATPFNKSVGSRRRLALCSVPFEEVTSLKDRHGVTINDVVIAMCAGAIRQWLVDQDSLPDQPLVVAVPVSIRADDDRTTSGNQLVAMFAPMATDESDPAARLRTTHEAMISAKQQHSEVPPTVMADACQLLLPTVTSMGFRLASRLRLVERFAPFNLLISTVPGPPGPLYCQGARMEHYYPISQIVDGQGLNITTFTFGGHLNIGILGDPDLTPDLDALADYLVKELQVLHEETGDHG